MVVQKLHIILDLLLYSFHLASNTIGWVSDITGKSVLDSVMFRVMAMEYEDDYIYKQVYITVKGVIDNV